MRARREASAPSSVACSFLDDNRVAAYLDGALRGQERDAVDCHLRECADCAALLGVAARLTEPPSPRPAAPAAAAAAQEVTPPVPEAAFGRYVVLGVRGRGGMGVVYSAYDPQLDRQVAIKVVRPDRDGLRSRVRLLREAQALARLMHPNVVTVHDIGTFHGQVFIAMEFIRGMTLSDWLRSPRPAGEIIDVLRQAAQGLAAAHACGLIHCDFKPDNVMVTWTRRVVVTDFGLANAAPPAAASPPPAGAEEAPARGERPTASGLVGTPPYLAPELYDGAPASEASDQFAFCVSFYRALVGSDPFPGEAERLDAMRSGRVHRTNERVLPGWLRPVLLRGLCADPAGRYPSMDALLSDLDRADPRRSGWRLRWGGAAALAALVLTTAGGLAWRSHSAGRCDAPPGRLAGIWDGARRAALGRALLAAGGPAAADSAARAQRDLDRYGDALRGAYREACEATQLRHEQSPSLRDRRYACLDKQRDELRALTGALLEPDRVAVARATAAIAQLPDPVRRCEPTRLLAETEATPADPSLRERVKDLRQRLAEARALRQTGRAQRALEQARALIREARDLGDAPMAEVLLNLGMAEQMSDRHPDAARTLLEAETRAIATGGDPIAAEAAIGRFTSLGAQYLDESVLQEAAARAEALVRRAGAEEWLAARLKLARGEVQLRRYRFAEARATLEALHQERARRFGPRSPEAIEALRALLHVPPASQARAVAAAEEVLAADRERYGEDSGFVVDDLMLLSKLVGDSDLARGAALSRQALAAAERVFGPGSPMLAEYLSEEAQRLVYAGQREAGFALIQRAVALVDGDAAIGEAQRQELRLIHAYLLGFTGRFQDAAGLAARALEALEAATSARDPRLISTLFVLSDNLLKSGRPAEALRHGLRALELGEPLGDWETLQAQRVTVGLSYLRTGQPARAIPVLEDALRRNLSVQTEADMRFALAQALRASGQDRERACPLAAQARSAYDAGRPERKEIEAWMRGRGTCPAR